jgi:hypothetical protein
MGNEELPLIFRDNVKTDSKSKTDLMRRRDAAKIGS